MPAAPAPDSAASGGAIELRPDQRALADQVQAAFAEGARAPVAQAPTGWGKTYLAAELIRREHALGGSVLVLVHRYELVEQFLGTARKAGLEWDFGQITSGFPEQSWQPHQIAMVQTLTRRLHRTAINPTLVIVDECHHVTATTYRRVLERFGEARVIGLTATPQRPDGQPLRGCHDHLACGPSIAECIERGILCPYDFAGLPTGLEDIGERHHLDRNRRGEYRQEDLAAALAAEPGVLANLRRNANEHLPGRRFIAFGPSIDRSLEFERQLRADGFRCRHIDGKRDGAARARALAEFRDGTIDGLLSVNLITEGFDCPDADCSFFYRPTESHVVWLQANGRVLRFAPGKTALIIDCAGVHQRLGYPSEDWVWTLDSGGKRKGAKAGADGAAGGIAKQCPRCYFAQPAGAQACARCGHRFGRPPKPPEEVDVTLEVVGYADLPVRLEKRQDGSWTTDSVRTALAAAYRADGAEGIYALARKLGYQRDWADKRIAERRPSYWIARQRRDRLAGKRRGGRSQRGPHGPTLPLRG